MGMRVNLALCSLLLQLSFPALKVLVSGFLSLLRVSRLLTFLSFSVLLTKSVISFSSESLSFLTNFLFCSSDGRRSAG